MSREVYVVSNFKCHVKTEGHLVTSGGSHVHCESDNISETMQDRNVVSTDRYKTIQCSAIQYL